MDGNCNEESTRCSWDVLNEMHRPMTASAEIDETTSQCVASFVTTC